MQVEGAEREGVENGLGQDQPIGHHDGDVCRMRTRRRFRFRAAQARGGKHWQAQTPRRARDRSFDNLHPTPPGGLRRAGVDRHHLVIAIDDLKQRRHGKIRRAHEYDAQRHMIAPLIPA